MREVAGSIPAAAPGGMKKYQLTANKKLIDSKSIAVRLRRFESYLSVIAKYARGQSRMFMLIANMF